MKEGRREGRMKFRRDRRTGTQKESVKHFQGERAVLDIFNLPNNKVQEKDSSGVGRAGQQDMNLNPHTEDY